METTTRAKPSSVRRRAASSAAILAAPLALGLLARADSHGATIAGVEGPRCLAGLALGDVGCPGCGLARGTALLLHGRWQEALALQPAAALVVLGCAAGFALHLHVLALGRRGAWHEALISFGARAFALGLLASWLARLF